MDNNVAFHNSRPPELKLPNAVIDGLAKLREVFRQSSSTTPAAQNCSTPPEISGSATAENRLSLIANDNVRYQL